MDRETMACAVNEMLMKMETETSEMRILLGYALSMIITDREQDFAEKNTKAIAKLLRQAKESELDISCSRMKITFGLTIICQEIDELYSKVFLAFIGTLIALEKEENWVKRNKKMINKVIKKADPNN